MNPVYQADTDISFLADIPTQLSFGMSRSPKKMAAEDNFPFRTSA